MIRLLKRDAVTIVSMFDELEQYIEHTQSLLDKDSAAHFVHESRQSEISSIRLSMLHQLTANGESL